MKDHFPVSPPPIPTPDGNIPPPQLQGTTMIRGDWKSAPPIVRGWAYPLTWLGIVVFPLLMLVSFLGATSKNAVEDVVGTAGNNAVENIIGAIIYGALLAFVIWLNRALKKGASAAWTAQIIWSIFGLLGFPLGTAIHAYILLQWFKPETKAWFGRS